MSISDTIEMWKGYDKKISDCLCEIVSSIPIEDQEVFNLVNKIGVAGELFTYKAFTQRLNLLGLDTYSMAVLASGFPDPLRFHPNLEDNIENGYTILDRIMQNTQDPLEIVYLTAQEMAKKPYAEDKDHGFSMFNDRIGQVKVYQLLFENGFDSKTARYIAEEIPEKRLFNPFNSDGVIMFQRQIQEGLSPIEALSYIVKEYGHNAPSLHIFEQTIIPFLKRVEK